MLSFNDFNHSILRIENVIIAIKNRCIVDEHAVRSSGFKYYSTNVPDKMGELTERGVESSCWHIAARYWDTSAQVGGVV